jgi:aspartate/methionine/tyrosine aminotransferase
VRAGVDIVDFGRGEPDFPTPANIKRAAIRAIEENFTRYTAAGGTQELKEAICERHAVDFETSYTPSECTVSAGGKHALFNVLQSLVDPGDEVVVTVPYWVTFTDIIAYCGGTSVLAHTEERDASRSPHAHRSTLRQNPRRHRQFALQPERGGHLRRGMAASTGSPPSGDLADHRRVLPASGL